MQRDISSGSKYVHPMMPESFSSSGNFVSVFERWIEGALPVTKLCNEVAWLDRSKPDQNGVRAIDIPARHPTCTAPRK